MTRQRPIKIRRERARPNCSYARGQKVRVLAHLSQPGIDYSGWCGVVTFSTAISRRKFLDFEQVTIALRNGPSIMLKIAGRHGVDKLRLWSFCDKCGERDTNCICNQNAEAEEECRRCNYPVWDCRCCGDCGEYGDCEC